MVLGFFSFGNMATETLTPLTELEAINDMLSLIAETPLASLDEVDGVADAQIAQQILHRESRAVQETGWSWNTEEDYSLAPDVNGIVNVPPNALDVDPSDQYQDYVWRAGKLWDRKNQTFNIGTSVDVNIKFFYAFDDLPAVARRYISIRAGRKFEDRMIADSTKHQINETDAVRAYGELLDTEATNKDMNVLKDSRLSVRRRYRNIN